MLKSLILPGWGDIYLGHRLLGCFELLGTLFIWFIFLGLLMSGLAEDLIFGLFLLVFYNGADSLLTFYMARKGYILANQQNGDVAATQDTPCGASRESFSKWTPNVIAHNN